MKRVVWLTTVVSLLVMSIPGLSLSANQPQLLASNSKNYLPIILKGYPEYYQLTCWSAEYQPNQCNSPVEIHNASVAVQDSTADCIKDVTWGFTSSYIWVKDGCRATFNINQDSAKIELPTTGQTKCYDSLGNERSCIGSLEDGGTQSGVGWPNPRFAVMGDCVQDHLTGLMWTRNANLRDYSGWSEALAYANNLNLCGYSDWRLPNIIELKSLLNFSQDNSITWLVGQGF